MADFGLARDVALEMEKGKFPVKWTAPEAIQDNVRHSIFACLKAKGRILKYTSWEIAKCIHIEAF